MSERKRAKLIWASRILVKDFTPRNIAGVTPPPSERSIEAAVEGFAMLVAEDGDAIVLGRSLRRDVVVGLSLEPSFCGSKGTYFLYFDEEW